MHVEYAETLEHIKGPIYDMQTFMFMNATSHRYNKYFLVMFYEHNFS